MDGGLGGGASLRPVSLRAALVRDLGFELLALTPTGARVDSVGQRGATDNSLPC